MGRHRPKQRRQVASNDSDSDSGNEFVFHAPTKSALDPKVALSISDLGKSSRDRITAHDMEQDRKIDRAYLSRIRKCNQEGTEEAMTAELDQHKLKKWAGLREEDPQDGLEDIAGGQYHRLTTSQKLQLDGQQPRTHGMNTPPDAVNNFTGARYGHVPTFANTGVQFLRQSSANTEVVSRPLDPAVDQDRVYSYKVNSKRGAKRGGRGGGHVGTATHLTHSIQVPIRAPVMPHPKAVGFAPRGASTHGQTARQRRIQDRPWPPVALVGNPEPPTTTPVHSPTSQLQMPTSATEATTSGSKISFKFSHHATKVNTTDDLPKPSVFSSAVKKLKPIQTDRRAEVLASSSGNAPNPVAQGNGSLRFKSPLCDPEGFMNWVSTTGGPQFSSSTPKHEPNIKPPAVDAKETNAKPITIPRTELSRYGPIAPPSQADSRTDGVLSPATTSHASNHEPGTVHEHTTDSVGISEHRSVPAISPVQSAFEHSLIDIDSQPEQDELIKPLIPSPVNLGNDDNTPRVPAGWIPGKELSEEDIAEFLASMERRFNIGKVIKTEMQPTEIPESTPKRIPATVTQAHSNPFSDPESPNRPLALDEKILDVISPGFRESATRESSTRVSRISNIPEPLHLVSSNFTHAKRPISSKWAEPGNLVKSVSNTEILQRVDSTLKDVTTSMLGDRNTRPPTNVKAPIKSVWAVEPEPTNPFGLERTISNQSHHRRRGSSVANATAAADTHRTLFRYAESSSSDSDGSVL